MNGEWSFLARPLRRRQRERIAESLRGLIQFGERLTEFPAAIAVPATPFVSLRVEGRLRACFGSFTGAPRQRMARAFLHAMADARFGGIAPTEWPVVTACVHFAHNPVECSASSATQELSPGTHGIAFVSADRDPVILLPDVARDGRLDAEGMLDTLRRKAGLDAPPSRVVRFEAETITSLGDTASMSDARDTAAAWLARELAAKTFEADPWTGARTSTGDFFHGRRAVALRALDEHGNHVSVVRRARAALARDIDHALVGRAPVAWPTTPSDVAATLALAQLAGIDRSPMLRHLASDASLRQNPWAASQVVLALGDAAPRALWASCCLALEARPWAPWTLMAALRLHDSETAGRCVAALLESIRRDEPHRGGCSVTRVPELALTALVGEALADVDTRDARDARRRIDEFLRTWQLGGAHSLALRAGDVGAFPLSPVHERLRIDVTGHALRALRA